jgi:predicted dehydrogenase
MTIAFIGVGNNGYGYMPEFLEDPRVKVVAVCDVNREGPGYWDGTVRGYEPARRFVDEFYKGTVCQAYTDYREVLARKDIDAVYIGTPDHWHAIHAIDSARAQKHIYCQKPLSLTVREGRAMSDAVQKSKVTWQTGSQQRSDAQMRRACELIRNGIPGKLKSVRAGLPGGIPDFGKTAHLTQPVPVPDGFDYDTWLGPSPKADYCPARVGVNYRWIRDYSGGQVTDWGAHHIDIVQWALDMDSSGPVAIRNAKGRFAEHPIYNTATEFSFECEYASGVTLFVSNKNRGGVTFETDNGWIWCNRGRIEASSPEILQAGIPRGGVKLYESEDHVKDFIGAVFSGGRTAAPVEAAHRSVSVAHLGNIALELGRDLRWDPKVERVAGDESANDRLARPYRGSWRLTS